MKGAYTSCRMAVDSAIRSQHIHSSLVVSLGVSTLFV